MYGTYTKNGKIYDPEQDYWDSMAELEKVRDNLPKYEAPYAQSLQELYREITERPKFAYDADDDALYQSYKQAYAQQGKLAMEDTMGQAAGLTGGYGSSYAQSVGQQQYDAYLQKLSDVYPELYSMAYNRYLDEGNAMMQQYEMLSGVADDDYEKYLDQLDVYYRDMGILQEQADTAYDRNEAAEEDAYNREQKAYDRLVDMMLTMGYVPGEEELQAAGMSHEHMEAYLNYYNTLSAVGTGKGGRGGKKDDDEADAYDTALAEAQSRIAKGTSVEEVNGEIAQKVARGELDAETAQKIIVALTKEHYG